MLLVVAAVLCVIVLSLVCISRGSSKDSNSEICPSYPGHFIIGNLLDLIPSKLLLTLGRAASSLNKCVSFNLLGRRVYLISDVSIAKEVLLKRPNIFRRTRKLNTGAMEVGCFGGLFHSSWSVWKRIHQLTINSFAKYRTKGNNLMMYECSKRWIERLNALNTEGIDMKHEISRYSVEIMTRTLFGTNSEFSSWKYFFSDASVKDMNAILAYLGEKMLFPFPQWMWRYLPYYQQIESKAQKANENLTKYCEDMMESHKQAIELMRQGVYDKSDGYNSLIDVWLRREHDHETAVSCPTAPSGVLNVGSTFNDHDVLANVKEFLLLGSDKMSVLLSWSLFYLLQYPVYLSNARAEAEAFHDAVQEAEKHGGGLTSDILDRLLCKEHMPLLHAVLKETLRMSGPLSFIALELEDITPGNFHTLSNGITINAHDEIWLHLDALHSDVTVYDHPHSFNPYRWLTTDSQKLGQMEQQSMWFGDGVRQCPAADVTSHAVLVALVQLLHQCDMKLTCPIVEIQRIWQFTSQINKLPVKIHQLQHKHNTGMM